MFTSRSQRIVSLITVLLKVLAMTSPVTSKCDCVLLWDFMQVAP